MLLNLDNIIEANKKISHLVGSDVFNIIQCRCYNSWLICTQNGLQKVCKLTAFMV